MTMKVERTRLLDDIDDAGYHIWIGVRDEQESIILHRIGDDDVQFLGDDAVQRAWNWVMA